jgi:hypothetical protein
VSRFLTSTVQDLRNGRESWPVIVMFSTIAFVVAVLRGLMFQ